MVNEQNFSNIIQDIDNLEEQYLEFLPWIKNKLGFPDDLPSLLKICYIVIRYLEGIINSLLIISTFTISSDKKIQELKQLLISWLQSIIDKINNI